MSDPAVAVPLPNRRATRLLARGLAHGLVGGDLVVLSGALGAGKTFLVRAIARALGLPACVRVVSPTFPLLRELPTAPRVAHADLYRLRSIDEAHELGLDERREQGEILIVEWGEEHRQALGPDGLSIRLDLAPRVARLDADGPRSRQLLDEVTRWVTAPGRLSPPTHDPSGLG